MGLIVRGSDVGPPGGYPPFRCKNPHGGPHAEPLAPLDITESSVPVRPIAPEPHCPKIGRQGRRSLQDLKPSNIDRVKRGSPQPPSPQRSAGRYDRAVQPN